jgi:hypothetical protein
MSRGEWYASCNEGPSEGEMNADAVETKVARRFMDISTAAFQAGYSTRHFRRIIEEDRIPVLQIGRKMFVLTRDLEAWKATKGDARFDQALKQLDGYLKACPKPSTFYGPIDSFDDNGE